MELQIVNGTQWTSFEKSCYLSWVLTNLTVIYNDSLLWKSQSCSSLNLVNLKHDFHLKTFLSKYLLDRPPHNQPILFLCSPILWLRRPNEQKCSMWMTCRPSSHEAPHFYKHKLQQVCISWNLHTLFDLICISNGCKHGNGDQASSHTHNLDIN